MSEIPFNTVRHQPQALAALNERAREIFRQIVALLRQLRQKLDMSILFICHDIALVQQFCDRVVVMYHGEIVEEGSRTR